MLQRMDEESHLSRKLKTNGYPQRFIRKQQGDKKTSKPDEPRKEPKASITLPYVQGLFEPIRKLEEADIRVRFKPNMTLRKLLVKPKDPVPVERRTGILYQIPCSDCSQTYVGQSGRTIVDRIKEHQLVVKNGDTNTSVVAEHAWKHQHRMDWSAAEVLDYSQQRFSRCMLESWHIHHQSDSMNRERGPLPTLCRSLWTSS